MTQIYKFKMFLLNFFDSCKSVLSAVRFWFLCKAPQFGFFGNSGDLGNFFYLFWLLGV